jgi:cell division protease FtsH
MPEEPRNDNQPPEQKRPGPPPVRFGRNLMGWLVFGLILALVLMVALPQLMPQAEELTPPEVMNHVRNGDVVSLLIKDDSIEGRLKPGIAGRTDKPDRFTMPLNPGAEKFLEKLQTELDKHPEIEWGFEPPPSAFFTFLPSLLLVGGSILLLWFLVFRRAGQGGMGGGFLGSFGRSRHRMMTKEHTNVTFEDVAGIEEAKDEVGEIVEFLRHPKRFARLGGRIPRGVLLVGEPGCGKTLLAKAIAGEAEVPFFSISGSDFVELFVGVGASRVRDLFRSAKESSPCIIFLDEIDAIGRKREPSFRGGGDEERSQTLNAILVEMDGFETSDQVIVIAATNRVDVLDPALTRPGRFDRQIQVPLPDIRGRYEILKIYAEKVQMAPDVDLHILARGTPMFSGADLAALVNEAAIAASMSNKDAVEQADLEEARDKVRWGRARKSRVIDDREKEMTAYHEAGHALVKVLTPESDPLHKVSIIPRGPAGGATFALPEKDRYLHTRKWCEAEIRVMVAGRIAEQRFCGDVDSGASSDIAAATEISRRMVMDWGMSEKLGFVRYAPQPGQGGFPDLKKEYSEKTAETIDAEVKAIMDRAYQETEELIRANEDKVKRIAENLLKYETLEAADVRKIMDGEDIDRPTMDDLLAREASRDKKPSGAPVESPPLDTPDIGPIPEPG